MIPVAVVKPALSSPLRSWRTGDLPAATESKNGRTSFRRYRARVSSNGVARAGSITAPEAERVTMWALSVSVSVLVPRLLLDARTGFHVSAVVGGFGVPQRPVCRGPVVLGDQLARRLLNGRPVVGL